MADSALHRSAGLFYARDAYKLAEALELFLRERPAFHGETRDGFGWFSSREVRATVHAIVSADDECCPAALHPCSGIRHV
jgi:hypothetical protein